MNDLALGFPSREEGLAFHLRLCDLDPVAVADVCRAYLNPLLQWLAARFASIDDHLRQTAAHDALMTYGKTPQAYDPNRSDLATYLRIAARGDLLNLLKREAKHHRGRVGWEIVEDKQEGGNLSGAEEPSLQLQRAEEAQQWQAFLQSVIEGFTEAERRVLQRMLAGERKTAGYAQALGIDALPPAEQEREVKKVKDRIKKRLARGGPAHA